MPAIRDMLAPAPEILTGVVEADAGGGAYLVRVGRSTYRIMIPDRPRVGARVTLARSADGPRVISVSRPERRDTRAVLVDG